jgi:DNA polymerase (family 10)
VSEQQPDSTELVRPCDVRGLLHAHTRYADGAHSLRRMVETARALGLEYLGISDHLRSERHPDGLDLAGEIAQQAEITALREEYPGFELMHGMEVDAAEDGSLDLPAGLRDNLDYLLAALPSPNGHSKESYTEAALRLIQNPAVDMVSRPLGCYMLTRPPVPLDMMRVLKAAAETGTVLELDANPACAELDGTHCRLAADLEVPLAINPNAHRAARLVDYRIGVQIARDMGLGCDQIVNTYPVERLRGVFARSGRS